MTDLTTQIRPIQQSDDKFVRFVIGKACLEPLTIANRRVYAHPFTISAWLLLSYMIVEFAGMWPAYQYGFLGYLRPVPVFAASAVPIMFFADWINRPIFEQLTHDALRGPDMTDLLGYYSRSPGSGFWVLTHKDHIIGLIAVDAPSEKKAGSGAERQESEGTAGTAIIRHFYVDEAYRPSGVQEDLLDHAVRFTFSSDNAIERIQASDLSLLPYIRKCLQRIGFNSAEKTQSLGVFGWKLAMRWLERDVWLRTSKQGK